MADVAEALSTGTRYHQAGQLAEAERCYRHALSIEPHNPDALHLLGSLALQVQRFDLAVELIGQAIRIDGRRAAFHANLGQAYRQLNKLPEAADAFRRALKLQGDLGPVHTMLGSVLYALGELNDAAACYRQALKLQPNEVAPRRCLGRVLHDLEDLPTAETCFRRVLQSEPNSAEAHFDLGSVLQSAGRDEEAAASYRRAIELDPAQADTHNNLGTILKDRKVFTEAEQHYRLALRANPGLVAARINLAVLCKEQGRVDEALAGYQMALQTEPANTLARNSLGCILLERGRIEEASDCFREVLRIDPTSATAHVSLGNAWQAQRKLNTASECYRQALRCDPTCALAHGNLGVALGEQGQHDEAITHYRRAIELWDQYALAHSNLGVALQTLGRLDEAIVHFRQAIEIDPEAAGVHSNLLYVFNFHPKYDPPTLFAEHRAWAQRHADPLTVRAAPHANDRTPDRRLRVGYVSAHFMQHAVNFFVEPILSAHDHAQCEIFCYSNSVTYDHTTEHLRGYADAWRDITYLNDDQAAERIRQDKIDILVDLTGHIGGTRLPVFARRPAPIQITYIGYQNTTGMMAMDYRLTDDYSDPPGTTEHLHTERLLRLPRTFFCYLPATIAPEITSSPAASNGYVTFGSFNNYTKITPEVLAVWADILLRVPLSRLIVRADMTAWLQQFLVETFRGHGIGVERLELVNRLPHPEYLALINRADIALDPFPFNGHTTTCDALWQGLPVVTLSGETYVSRFGGSGLATLGLHDLIAHDRQQYVEIAASLAADPARLASLRTQLRPRMSASPLLDFPGFARHLEAAYRDVWREWCAR